MNRFRNFMSFTLLLSIIVAFLSINGLTKDKPVNSFVAYNNKEYGIRINRPPDWPVQDGYMGTVVAILAPQENSPDPFRENLNIIVQDLSQQPMTLEEYTQLSMTQLNQLMNGFKLEKKGTAKISTENAYQVVYSFKQGQIDLKLFQKWCIKNNRAYILTYTAEKKNYNKYYPTMEKMMNSFQFNNNAL